MLGSWGEADIPELAGKRALVTGAASGIGFEAARALASRGAEVWIVDRNRQAGAAAMERIKAITATARLEFHGLDLSDLDAVRAFALARHREGRAIDILVNNAGPYLGHPAAAGPLPLLFAATSGDAKGGEFYGPDGLGEMRGWPGPARVKRVGRDMAQAHRLWQMSEELTETKFPLPG